MFFKPKEIPNKEYKFEYNGESYSLEYPNMKFTQQYEMLTPILNSWIVDEWKIISANPGVPLQNRVLVQLARVSMRNLAKMEYRQYLRKISCDPNGFTTFARFLDVMAMVHIACDPKFIDVLRMRFLKTQIDQICGKVYISRDDGEEPELLPTKEDWLECVKEFPWVWAIPHIQILFYGNNAIQSEFSAFYQQQSRP